LSQINEDEAVRLLSQLLSIKAVGGEEHEIGEFVSKKLKEMGLRVDTFTIDPHRDPSFPKIEGRPVLLGYVDGANPRPCLLLEGHMDTVPAGEMSEWKFDPWSGRVDSGYILGRGATDSKGSLAAMMIAANAIRKSGLNLKGTLALAATSGGEYGGAGWNLLVDKGITDRVDWVIAGECTGDSEIGIAYPGSVMWEIQTVGKTGHVTSYYEYPDKIINAILKMSRFLSLVESEGQKLFPHREHPYLFSAPYVSSIEGSAETITLVPDRCRTRMWTTMVPGQTVQDIENDLRNALDNIRKEDPQFSYEIRLLTPEVEPGMAPSRRYNRLPYEVSPDDPVVTALSEATLEVTGKRPRLARFTGWWDSVSQIAMYAEMLHKHVPSGATFGPGDTSLPHAPNEKLGIRQLVDAAKIYALVCVKLLL